MMIMVIQIPVSIFVFSQNVYKITVVIYTRKQRF